MGRPAHAVLEVGEFVDELGRNYRRVDGYSLKAKLKEARERARAAARSRTTSSSSAGATRSGRGSRPSSRRTSPSPRSPRTRSATRGRSTSSLADGRRRARVRPHARRVPVRAARRAPARAGLGADDRAPLLYETADELRLRRSWVGRRGGRGPGGEDRARGGLPPDARADVGRPAARRAALLGGPGRALAVRARTCRPPKHALSARRAPRLGPTLSASGAERTATSWPGSGGDDEVGGSRPEGEW